MKTTLFKQMAKYQDDWDPLRDRRTSESKLFRESYMFGNSVNSTKRYLISKDWFNQWMSFLYGRLDECPRKIDNTELAHRIMSEGFNHLVKNVDYFEFPTQTWEGLMQVYRGGPAIQIKQNGKIEIEQV